jgi:hypothetical protein
VFHFFFRLANHMSAIFVVYYYCQHAKLNISTIHRILLIIEELKLSQKQKTLHIYVCYLLKSWTCGCNQHNIHNVFLLKVKIHCKASNDGCRAELNRTPLKSKILFSIFNFMNHIISSKNTLVYDIYSRVLSRITLELPIARTDFDSPLEFEPAKFHCTIFKRGGNSTLFLL